MIDAFGWTWEYIDEEMTLPRLEVIVTRWDLVPPLSVSCSQMASYFGVSKPRSKKAKAKGSKVKQDLGALVSMFGGGAAGFSITGAKP